MAKKIPVTYNGLVLHAWVDNVDYDLVTQYNWTGMLAKTGKIYARTHIGNGVRILMHRLIMNTPKGEEVDHINGNTLDNRRKKNLRNCSRSQNRANRTKQLTYTSSRYKGVWWDPVRCKYQVGLTINGKRKYIGYFIDEIEAAKAYDKAAIEQWGVFASVNFK